MIAGAAAALIITLHDNTITMARDVMGSGVGAAPVLWIDVSRDTLTLRGVGVFSLRATRLPLPERYFAHAITYKTSRLWAAGSCRSRQPLLPIKQRMLHAHWHLCDGCVQSKSPDEIYSRESWTRHDV